jgi:hypothetical protein
MSCTVWRESHPTSTLQSAVAVFTLLAVMIRIPRSCTMWRESHLTSTQQSAVAVNPILHGYNVQDPHELYSVSGKPSYKHATISCSC